MCVCFYKSNWVKQSSRARGVRVYIAISLALTLITKICLFLFFIDFKF